MPLPSFSNPNVLKNYVRALARACACVVMFNDILVVGLAGLAGAVVKAPCSVIPSFSKGLLHTCAVCIKLGLPPAGVATVPQTAFGGGSIIQW